MATLLNDTRPPVFCPGCSHDRVVRALDDAFSMMGLSGDRVCMVSDIGCSGLFDTFFNTHAFHGLHGRVLTYATGIKLQSPEIKVVATIGDGGLGIGGAHLIAACKRNLDITLLVLDNYNFGMTGGQHSVTTPQDATVNTGFLSRLERPLELAELARSAGAPFVASATAYEKELAELLREAVEYPGFSIVEMRGLCTGRYTPKNDLSPKMIEAEVALLREANGKVHRNDRPEFGAAYREEVAKLPVANPVRSVEAEIEPPPVERVELLILGTAGQRIMTAGELVGLAGMAAGYHAAQKNEYNITVLTGPSNAEVTLARTPIGYTGMEQPDIVLALGCEGVKRRRDIFGRLDEDAIVVAAANVEIPDSRAKKIVIPLASGGVKKADVALTALGALAELGLGITPPMLERAVALRFSGAVAERAIENVANGREAAKNLGKG